MANLNNLEVYGSLLVTQAVTGITNSINLRIFTNLTTTVFTPSSTSVKSGLVLITGGGGGGGSGTSSLNASGAGGGGGGGGTIIFNCTYDELNGATFITGAGGSGGTAGGNGSTGGSTIFTPVNKPSQIATGGAGGTGTAGITSVGSFAGGIGGIPISSQGISIPGGSGRTGWGTQAGSGLVVCGGKGGSSIWASNEGNEVRISQSIVTPAASENYGIGGAGGTSLNFNGQAAGGLGSRGIVLVLEFLS